MRGRCFTFGVVVAAVAAVALAAGPVMAQPEPEKGESLPDVHLLTFEVDALDGVDVLVLKDGKVSIEHLEWQPMKGMGFRMGKAFPRSPGYRVQVANKKGRSKVTVVQQPREQNGYELRVLLDDGGPAGAAALSFDLVAVWRRVAPNPVNVVIVTIDSLRADRLRCYGYQRNTSPAIDELAWSGVRYSRFFSTSSFTPPSHASLFTSRWVGDHGLLTWNPLPEEQLTLAEVLSYHGYQTGASVCCSLLSDQNLSQGFAWRREGTRDGRAIVSDGLEFIRKHGDEPFFLWLHLYDVHRPYGRVPGWRERFGSSQRPDVGDSGSDYNLTPKGVRNRQLDKDDLRYITDRYDAGTLYADTQLRPLFEELSTPQRLQDTMLIVTADHGEALLDHEERLFTHDPYLRSAVTHIPLVIRFPAGKGADGKAASGGRPGKPRTDGAVASLVDIPPTVLEVVGVAAPPTFQGKSLAPKSANPASARKHVFMECWGWEEKKAIRTERWLVVHDMKASKTVAYDLKRDPGEREPIPEENFAKHHGLLALTKKLTEFVARAPGGQAAPELTAEMIEKLRQLGYVK